MIDDKKIEKAARYYCNNRYPASQDAPFIAEGFRHGAKWMREEFLKNLWHPISEEPVKDKPFLYQTLYDGFGLNQISDAKDWKFIIKYQKATKWLYIEDLIFKQKGGWND